MSRRFWNFEGGQIPLDLHRRPFLDLGPNVPLPSVTLGSFDGVLFRRLARAGAEIEATALFYIHVRSRRGLVSLMYKGAWAGGKRLALCKPPVLVGVAGRQARLLLEE